MKHRLIIILSLFVLLCESQIDSNIKDSFQQNFSDTISIGYEPININAVNSEYDDYNSYIGYSMSMNHLFIFSTNRKSKGHDFDITSFNFALTSDYSRHDSSTYEFYIIGDSLFSKNLPEINSDFNEYGPYLQLIDFTPDNHAASDKDSLMLFITRDENNNQDILCKKYSHWTYESDYIALENDFKHSLLINSDYDDAYASVSHDFKKMFFCSNRDGDFNIYQLNSSDNANIYNVLYNDSTHQLDKINQLCSIKDDKCPFIDLNIMVFTSNRDGGFGGYDLYYSKFENNKWSEPNNFGNKINSEFDEYRPISIDNNVMIFSSNRPGGNGGFDLYIVRITDIR
ncbi:MAG: PD40 domain-containing protein [Bacteroidales bacterium]|nr:PD40 domain-containing protein [Bacteroidales bacterium]